MRIIDFKLSKTLTIIYLFLSLLLSNMALSSEKNTNYINELNTIESYLLERLKLESIKDPSIFFLTKKGTKVYEMLIYRIITGYFDTVSSKVKKSPHILRHSFATHLLNNGADINSVKELLGHSSLAATQVYTHNSVAELKKVYEKSHPRNLI